MDTRLKIAKRLVKTNQDIIGEQCIKNDDGVLTVSDEDKKIACKSYHGRFLNTESAWDRNSLSQVDGGLSKMISWSKQD